MAKTTEARGTDRKVKSPTEAEIRAAMAKAIREVKRAAHARIKGVICFAPRLDKSP